MPDPRYVAPRHLAGAKSINAPIAVAFGGPSPEHDVSVITGLQAVQTLAGGGHEVAGLYWSKTGEWWSVPTDVEPPSFAEGVPDGADELEVALGEGFVRPGRLRSKTIDIDVVVNACHGGPGEDGTLQALFDLAGIRYTGPDRASAAFAMDKLAFGAISHSLGLPTLPRAVYADTVETPPSFDGPYVVKPRFGGSSIGTEVVSDAESLTGLVEHGVHFRAGAVVEPFLEDAIDLNIGIRSYPEVEVSAVERPERAPGSGLLAFSDKYTAEEGMAGADRELPAELPQDVTDELRSMGLAIGQALPVRGVARLDFLMHDEELYVNELNTVPGSLAKYLWIDPEVSFLELLEAMVAEARERPTYRPSVEGADGALLQSATSIAKKLR